MYEVILNKENYTTTLFEQAALNQLKMLISRLIKAKNQLLIDLDNKFTNYEKKIKENIIMEHKEKYLNNDKLEIKSQKNILPNSSSSEKFSDKLDKTINKFNNSRIEIEDEKLNEIDNKYNFNNSQFENNKNLPEFNINLADIIAEGYSKIRKNQPQIKEPIVKSNVIIQPASVIKQNDKVSLENQIPSNNKKRTELFKIKKFKNFSEIKSSKEFLP